MAMEMAKNVTHENICGLGKYQQSSEILVMMMLSPHHLSNNIILI